MQQLLTKILFILLGMNLHAQQNSQDYKVYKINKAVKDFPDNFDLCSPLKSFVSFKYLKSKGKQGLYRTVNSHKTKGFFPKENAPDIYVEDRKRESLLNTQINEIIIYKDSIAGIFTDYQKPMQIITNLTLEDGKWLNVGEALGNDIEAARIKFKANVNVFVENIYQIEKLKNVSADTLSFVNYLKENGNNPKNFVLSALSEHKIVIYGEIHRRQKSWELMKSIIKDRKFPQRVGIVFMELSSDKQNELDDFFADVHLDKERILRIFRDVQLNGWYDRGMYEFLIELWNINKKLPPKKQIKVIAVDEPRPFGTFKTKEAMEAHFSQTLERNDQMAKVIYETVKGQKDKRNNFFIVGAGHAYKSMLHNNAIGSHEGKMKPTVAAQLSTIFSKQEVFSIVQHMPIISNNGTVHGETRNGIFDYAFSMLGNKPIAFLLKDSPFGKEPFDALYEISYNKMTGNYEDNYDAYLFLEPLKTESAEYLLDEVITTNYLKELHRRAKILNTTLHRWFGIDTVTVETIKETLQFNSNEKRWEAL